MSAVAYAASPASLDHIDRCLGELTEDKTRLSRLTLAERRELLEDCLRRTVELAREWVEAACNAKGIPAGSPMRGEEVAAGPMATARHLRLLIQDYQALETSGHIPLPGPVRRNAKGQLLAPVMPVKGLFDPLVFAGFKATCWLSSEVQPADLEHLGEGLKHLPPSSCVLVLGAGNVSSIPVTDAISKIFQEGKVVLLKMNPVNEYLGPIFERLFARLIAGSLIRIVYGGAEVGAAALEHAQVDEVHITGSIHSHDAIVWGQAGGERERRKQENDPRLHKPITSELGNVSPWIIVPGNYTEKQLRFQAENVASSITNNASFNCVATKVIVTWNQWPQRQQFLDLLEGVLAGVPPRHAYYPGACDRFARFSGGQAPAGSDLLPWTLVRDVNPETSRQLFAEESFVCVCAEFGLAVDNEQDFLPAAVRFANEKLWGTLSAAVTVPNEFRRDPEGEALFQTCLSRLRYGAVGVNYWPALVYAMMSPPWGGYPGATLADAQSGLGSVHNTFMLDHVEKTVLEGPLTMSPKPFWFPTHRRPEPIAWKALDLYARPSAWKLPALMLAALRG